MIHLDTHAVVWLYQKEKDRFTERGRELVEREELDISPIVELEIEYLFEIEKIRERSSVILDYLRRRIGVKHLEDPFPEVVKKALELKWTRDPFDRLITAHAALGETRLLTKDAAIHDHYPKAVW